MIRSPLSIGWKQKILGDLARVKGGRRLPKGHSFSDRTTEHPYLRVTDFKNYSIETSNLKYLDDDDWNSIKHYTIGSEDVYISIAGTIGLVGTVPCSLDGANLTENAAKLMIKDKNEIDKNYLVYYLSSGLGQNEIEARIAKTSQPKLAISRIETIPLSYPPLPEQRAIARALRAVQGAREARLRELALEKERKAALMEHLFTHGTRGEATKMTDIGEMPESWKIERIDACCAKSSLKNPKDNPDKSFSYVDVSSVSNESYRIIETKKILGRDAPSRARKHIKKDDVIFATVRPTLKRIALVPFDLDGQICSTGFCVLRANRDNLNPLYLYYYLLTEQIAKKVDILQKGATYPAISDSELLNQLAPVPPINEQAQIAGILCACDSKIAALDHEARLHDELFRAMLEELMSGRLPAGALVEDAA